MSDKFDLAKLKNETDKKIEQELRYINIKYAIIIASILILGIYALCKAGEYVSCDLVNEHTSKIAGTGLAQWSITGCQKMYITQDGESRPGWVRIWLFVVDDLKKDCCVKDKKLLFEIPLSSDTVYVSGETQTPKIDDWFNGDW